MVTSAASAEYPRAGKNSVLPLVQAARKNASIIKNAYFFMFSSQIGDLESKIGNLKSEKPIDRGVVFQVP
jgi:hypothetical protein